MGYVRTLAQIAADVANVKARIARKQAAGRATFNDMAILQSLRRQQLHEENRLRRMRRSKLKRAA